MTWYCRALMAASAARSNSLERGMPAAWHPPLTFSASPRAQNTPKPGTPALAHRPRSQVNPGVHPKRGLEAERRGSGAELEAFVDQATRLLVLGGPVLLEVEGGT